MGRSAVLNGCEKSSLHRDSIPGPSQVAVTTELPRAFILKLEAAVAMFALLTTVLMKIQF